MQDSMFFGLDVHKARISVVVTREDHRRHGFHCLSGWDGSHPDFKAAVRKAMREPDNFEHIERRITPVDDEGYHSLRMDYRARNGFGGMNVGQAAARIRQLDCSFTIEGIE